MSKAAWQEKQVIIDEIKEKLDKGELAEIYIDSFHESEAFYCIYTDEIQKKEQAAHFMEFCISRGIGE